MPNHVTNHLHFSGDKEQIAAIMALVIVNVPEQQMTGLAGETTLCYVRNNPDGTTDYGWFDTERNRFSCRIPDPTPEAPYRTTIMEFGDEVPDDWEPNMQAAYETFDFETIIPMPKQVFRGNLSSRQQALSGGMNWYDWSVSNWGTKWNSYSFHRLDDGIAFDTAWSPPEPVIEKLSEMFPEVHITHEYFDEGWNFWGVDEYLAGEKTVDGCCSGEMDEEGQALCMDLKGYDPLAPDEDEEDE
jgi:hypothetical protein